MKLNELIQTFIQNPAEWQPKYQELEYVLYHMMHTTNKFRPHHARESVISLQMHQIEQRNKMMEQLDG